MSPRCANRMGTVWEVLDTSAIIFKKKSQCLVVSREFWHLEHCFHALFGVCTIFKEYACNTFVVHNLSRAYKYCKLCQHDCVFFFLFLCDCECEILTVSTITPKLYNHLRVCAHDTIFYDYVLVDNFPFIWMSTHLMMSYKNQLRQTCKFPHRKTQHVQIWCFPQHWSQGFYCNIVHKFTSGISHFYVNDVCIIAVVWPRDASSAWLFRKK